MSLTIPSIDIGAGLNKPECLHQLSVACEQWGIFELTGHGVSERLRKELFETLAAFFVLPPTTKRKLSRTADNFWGYYDRELTKNHVDAKEIFDMGANASALGQVPWPGDLPAFESVLKRWASVVEVLARDLLNALCLTLGKPTDTLDAAFGQSHTSFLRLNHYPPETQRARAGELTNHDLGIHPHTDAGGLTVLAHDGVPGLQVAQAGAWHTVVAEPDSLIINIGDMLQVWSNDRFKAPEHRVLASKDRPRYSAAYFYNPAYETVCRPLEDDTALHRYRPVSWREFRDQRAAGDYADVGEEVQISWYRVRGESG